MGGALELAAHTGKEEAGGQPGCDREATGGAHPAAQVARLGEAAELLGEKRGVGARQEDPLIGV